MMKDKLPEPGGQTPAELPADRESILNLDFGPNWVRQRPEPEIMRRGFGEAPRNRRPSRPGRSNPVRRRAPEAAHPPRSDGVPEVKVSFAPRQEALSVAFRKIRKSRRTYPLLEIAALLARNTDHCLVRIESVAVKGRLRQCPACGLPAFEEQTIKSHWMRAHVEEYFEPFELDLQEPQGQFACVWQCGISGALLGPPNHHSTSRRMRELRAIYCPEAPLEEYREQVKVLRGPEAIAQWKKSYSQGVGYRQRGGDGRRVTLHDIGVFFDERFGSRILKHSGRVVFPGDKVADIPDRSLRASVAEAWRREQQFPASLLFALRAALRRMGLHVFRMGGKEHYVAAVAPAVFGMQQTSHEIHALLDFISEHPGSCRSTVLKENRLEGEEGAPAGALLRWLIESGHVLELPDGKLLVPR